MEGLLLEGTSTEVSTQEYIFTVNSEIFGVLFSRMILKDMFVMLKIRDWSMIYLHQ